MRIEGRDEVRSYSLVDTRPQDGAYWIAVRGVTDSRGSRACGGTLTIDTGYR